MKFLLSICLLATSTSLIASAQQRASLSRTQIKEAESQLAKLGYWTGPIDGIFDAGTKSALIAFQKWEGREVTGKLSADELETIRNSSSPSAREVGYEHVEIDIDRQVMLIVNAEGGVKALPVSTGTGKQFFDDGQTSIAYTPRGRFIVYDKIAGWESGPIGRMYYPNYISGGIAIHGSRSVPTKPATHGCIRVPMYAAREVSKLLKLETIVLVYDKVSFVSGRPWAENPKLKQSASIE